MHHKLTNYTSYYCVGAGLTEGYTHKTAPVALDSFYFHYSAHIIGREG